MIHILQDKKYLINDRSAQKAITELEKVNALCETYLYDNIIIFGKHLCLMAAFTKIGLNQS